MKFAERSLSHIDASGKASMVDVTTKAVTARRAVAQAVIELSPKAISAIENNSLAKGDVFAVARIAAIQAAKRTWELIPLCHQIPLTSIALSFEIDHDSHSVVIRSEAKTTAQTGVEMEALTAASVAALTIYDMTKSIAKSHRITSVELVSKSGGKSGDWNREVVETSPVTNGLK